MVRDKKAQKDKEPEIKPLEKNAGERDNNTSPPKELEQETPMVSLSLDTVLTESDVKGLLKILSSSSEDKKR